MPSPHPMHLAPVMNRFIIELPRLETYAEHICMVQMMTRKYRQQIATIEVIVSLQEISCLIGWGSTSGHTERRRYPAFS